MKNLAPKFVPELEEMESRVVPAVTKLGNQIIVNGTGQSERIQVTQNATSIVVKRLVNARVVETKPIPKAGVKQINIFGKGGDDVITVAQGIKLRTLIDAGAGNDTVAGGGGVDQISGGASSDYLQGRNGNDRLSGGDGIDFLVGGLGNDLLDGGNDQDLLVGGLGTNAGVNGFVIDLLFDAPIVIPGVGNIGTVSLTLDDPADIFALTFTASIAGGVVAGDTFVEVFLDATSLGSVTTDAGGNGTFEFALDFDQFDAFGTPVGDGTPDILQGVPLPIPEVNANTLVTVNVNSPIFGFVSDSATIGELLLL